MDRVKRLLGLYKPKTKLFNKSAKSNLNKLKSYSNALGTNYKNRMNLSETRRRLSMIPMSNTSCRIGRKQIGGTCWFQSIMNGWLLSDKARLFLKIRLNAYKRYKNTKPVNHCPSRRKFDPDLFFSYIDYYFKGNKNESQNKYKNVNLIANLSMAQKEYAKGMNGSNSSYASENVKNFMRNVFGNNWSTKPGKDIYIIKNPKNTPGYTLSHAIISMSSRKSLFGHAVTGYMCNGKPIVYDSNANRYLDIDWRSKRGMDQLKLYYTLYNNNDERETTAYYDAVFYLRVKPRFLNESYKAPKLNVLHISNERKKIYTGLNHRASEFIASEGKIGITSSINLLKNIYRKKFKKEPPLITNSTYLYHAIKGIPYNGKLTYENSLKNKYSDSNLNKFLINRFKKTNKSLSADNKRKILSNFYYDIPWYDESAPDTWKKVYRLVTGKRPFGMSVVNMRKEISNYI